MSCSFVVAALRAVAPSTMYLRANNCMDNRKFKPQRFFSINAVQVVFLQEEVGPLGHHGLNLSIVEDFVQKCNMGQSLQSATLIPFFNYLETQF